MPLIIAEAVEVVLVAAVDLQEEDLAAEEEAAGNYKKITYMIFISKFDNIILHEAML